MGQSSLSKRVTTTSLNLGDGFKGLIVVGRDEEGDEVCLDAWRQGSCEPFVNIIFEPVHVHQNRIHEIRSYSRNSMYRVKP